MNKKYIPDPLDISAVELDSGLLELTELLARNIHDVWARQRFSEGWTYGSERNDRTKQHPGLVPYEELPDTEKVYDRNTALETLKVIRLLGYEVTK